MSLISAIILDVDYKTKEDEVTVRLHIKTSQGKKIIKDQNFKPYFYVKTAKKHQAKLKKSINQIPKKHQLSILNICESKKHPKFLKIFSNLPHNIPKLKELISNFSETQELREYDIPFHKRYLIDNNLCPLENYVIDENSKDQKFISMTENTEIKPPEVHFMAFDIETFNDEIIMASFYGKKIQKVITSVKVNNPQKYLESVTSEKELIKRIFEILSNESDIVFGYNTDRFDFPLLKERALNHGLTDEAKLLNFQRRGVQNAVKVKNNVHLDLYLFFTRILGQEIKSSTFRLHDISHEFLGEGKDDLTWREIHKIWREKNNLKILAKYALKDAELTYRLGEKFFPLITSISKLVGILPFEVCRSAYGTLVEQYLILMSHKNKLLVPNKPNTSDVSYRRSKSYEGAFVLEPTQGRFENLVMYDYRSLYPSILISHNISPDTFKGKVKKTSIPDFTYDFDQSKEGFLPKVLKSIIEERGNLKKQLKTLKRDSEKHSQVNSRVIALKYILNSSYGYLGYPNARWYCQECAESITFLGRHYIKTTIKEAEKQGFKVLYGDTDSLLFQYKDKEKALNFKESINKKLPRYMELELEDWYQKGLFTFTKEGRGAKKRYALLSADNRIKVRGFEQVRRDWSPLAKDLQQKVIDLVLHNKEKEAHILIKKTVQDLKNKKIKKDQLGIYTRMRKNPKAYHTSAPHVAAAKRAIERGEIIDRGQTIQYVITDKQGKISDKAELMDFATSYDSTYYIENQVVPAALRIMKIFGYEKEDYIQGSRQTGLKRFIPKNK